MIRLIIDKLGNGHDDLFLKIDSMPSYSKTADSYYLLDFLEISENDIEKLNLKSDEILKYGTIKLLDYWTDRIKGIENGQKKFVPFDLWDEYIGGIMLEKTQIGFKIKIVYTDRIQGYGVGKSNLDEQIEGNKVTFTDEVAAEWLIGEEALYKGLEWSKNELTN